MEKSRIRMSLGKQEIPPNLYSDFEWIRTHENEFLAQYGEKFIVVFEKQVLGSGASRPEALENAEKNLSPEIAEITPVLYKLHQPQIFVSAYLRKN